MVSIQNRGEKINSYILMTQVIFNLLLLIIIFKYYKYGFTNFLLFQSLNFLFLSLCLIITIGYVFFRKGKVWLDFILIILDILLINFVMVKTQLYEVRFLYTIPVLIVSIKYSLYLSTLFSFTISLYNIFFDFFTVQKFLLQYSIETDLIFGSILIIISWLIGSFIQIEKEVRENLNETNEKLIEQRKLTEKIVNEMPLNLIAVDKDERIVLINQSSLDFIQDFDKKPVDFLGKSYSTYCSHYSEKKSKANSFLKQALVDGKSILKAKRILNNKLVEVTALPIFDNHGEITNALIIFEDITAQELIKEKIIHLEKLNSVGQMAASIAHEIKNPLTTIKGFLELGLKSKDYLDQENLKLLLSEVERCNNIVTDFLSTARKNNGEVKKKINLADIMENYLPLIERDALFNNVKVATKIEKVKDLFLNEGEIKQLILNLTRNAIEAMSEGGTLTLRVLENDKSVILEVEDQGMGIPAHVLEKIGTPFLTTKENGTGLGLTVCYHIAKNHNAEINITSKENVGTKFQVIFPKSEQSIS